jgi:S1-C subfamily serine protease
MKFRGKILNIVFILIIGGLGGILADQLLLPYLATIPPFSQIEFIHQTGNGTTIINPTEEIIITENTAIEEAIDKVSPCLVAIHSYQNKRLLSQETGFFITSDGLLVSSGDLVSTKVTQYLVFRDGHSSAAKLIKRDLENNLALFQIEENNLPVVSLADLEELHLGERVILLGAELVGSNLNKFVNLGIIRSISQETLKLNLNEESLLANGSPLINIKGEVIGLNLVDQKGLLRTIPADKIKEFIGL